MGRFYRFILVTLVSLYVPQTLAQEDDQDFSRKLSYTYISLEYINFSKKLEDVPDTLDGDGYSIDISYAVRPHIALTAAYNVSDASVQTSGTEYQADIDSYSLGFLIHAAINNKSDFIVGAGFINGKAEVTASDGTVDNIDEDGGMTTVGFRALVYDDVEVASFIRKNSIENTSSYSISFAASYYANDAVSIDLGYLLDSKDGSELISLSLTRYF
jgi:hypothetical protein